jgi:hypothetical protein
MLSNIFNNRKNKLGCFNLAGLIFAMQTSPANIRLSWKPSASTNALAYLPAALVAKENFVNFINLFFPNDVASK